MTPTAIISDIHANIQALEAVLADADAAGAERFWCLGDVVGYGARPLECLEIVRERCGSQIIKGNHEQAVITGPEGFNPLASQAITWTRDSLGGDERPEAIRLLDELPEHLLFDDATLYHGSPSHPLDEYLFREDALNHLPQDRDYSDKLSRCFREIDRPCFVGHTHVPGVIDPDMLWVDVSDCGGRYDTGGRPCIVNVGSVGQPRDGDRRASYALFDGRVVTFRRVSYDVEAAARQIFAADGLPDLLGQRLLEAW